MLSAVIGLALAVVVIIAVPGFLPVGTDPWPGLLLALVPSAVGLVSDSIWVELSSRARVWLSGSSRSQPVIKAVGGALLVLLAAVLAAETFRG